MSVRSAIRSCRKSRASRRSSAWPKVTGGSSPGIQSASTSTQPKRRSNSIRSVDSVKSSSAYCGCAARLPRGSWSSRSTMSQSAHAKSSTGTHPQAVDTSRSDSVSARYTSPQNRSCRSAWTSARR